MKIHGLHRVAILTLVIATLAVAASPARSQPVSTDITAPRPTENLAAPCLEGGETMNRVLGGGNEEVEVTCSLTLRANAKVTRKLVYSASPASNTTLTCTCDESDCTTLEGGIDIRSPSGQGRPENITIRNCKITGKITINDPHFTLCPDDPPLECRHRRAGFEEWIHARAPHAITFDRVKISGKSGNRLYVGWGVTDTRIINSVFEGESSGVPIYLAPSSTRTLIKNNRIHTVTTGTGPDYYSGRESISIDGSDHNRIINNWFGALSRGGIYVYRNCGENGGVRQTTPSHNHIVNNVFYYDHYNGSAPAVFLGSRNGESPGWDHCDEDVEDHGRTDYGSTTDSSWDDRDFATHNIVMQNDVVKRSVSAALSRSLNWVNNSQNLIDRNRRVSTGDWPRPRAGCYVRGGEKEFILHGETTEKFMGSDGLPTCEKVTCDDGELRPAHPQHDVVPPSPGATFSHGVAATSVAPASANPAAGEAGASSCRTRRVDMDCRVAGNNDGCRRTVSCPTGTKIVGALAACNLESGSVTDEELRKVPAHLIHVTRLSDYVPSGSCFVGDNSVTGLLASPQTGFVIPQRSVQSAIRGIAGRTQVTVGCNEYDDNGGDCDIRGWLYCR